jgi:hypothetical protein
MSCIRKRVFYCIWAELEAQDKHKISATRKIFGSALQKHTGAAHQPYYYKYSPPHSSVHSVPARQYTVMCAPLYCPSLVVTQSPSCCVGILLFILCGQALQPTAGVKREASFFHTRHILWKEKHKRSSRECI